MTARVLRFPRRVAAILVIRERDGGGWLAIAGANGWLFDSYEQALREAKWLAVNFSVPLREIAA